jgi:hypothetical protein
MHSLYLRELLLSSWIQIFELRGMCERLLLLCLLLLLLLPEAAKRRCCWLSSCLAKGRS